DIKKKGRQLSLPPPGSTLIERSEVERRTVEEVPAEGVIGTPVAVAAGGRHRAGNKAAAEQRRILVEDVVDAKAQVVVVAHGEGAGEVEVALRRNMRIKQRHSVSASL